MKVKGPILMALNRAVSRVPMPEATMSRMAALVKESTSTRSARAFSSAVSSLISMISESFSVEVRL